MSEKFNASFWKWFKDSIVVDERGDPMVVYHGTPDVRGIFSHGFRKGSRGDVFFASIDYETANTYADDRRAWDYQNAEPHVIPLYLLIQNPMVIDAKGRRWKDTEKYVIDAKDLGHDGIIIENSRDFYNEPVAKKAPATTVFAWFDPRQAKSALTGELISRVDRKPIKETGSNDGSWDADDPDIRSNPVSSKTWYHGTNDEFFNSIKKHGLRKPFLTDIKEIAIEYAEVTSGDGVPIVFVVKGVDESKFIVDEKSLQEPVGYRKITSKKMDEMVDGLLKKRDIGPYDWRLTLPITRTVQYDGVIGFENIKDFFLVE